MRAGDVLSPERELRPVLEELRQALGSDFFSAHRRFVPSASSTTDLAVAGRHPHPLA